MMHRLPALLAALFGAALLAARAPARAQEVTLKAASAFSEGTYYARNFERFIKKVNDEGKGIVQIRYVGGPKAIPTFEIANALRSGVIDLANTTTSFTTGVVPEGVAMNYTRLTMAEMRRNGVIDYMNGIFQSKGLYYYARTAEGIQFYIYSNKTIDKADLSGLKLRIAPVYRDFFQQLGASVVQTAPGEVYTALERGVVDGYGWPLIGIFDLGLAGEDQVPHRTRLLLRRGGGDLQRQQLEASSRPRSASSWTSSGSGWRA